MIQKAPEIPPVFNKDSIKTVEPEEVKRTMDRLYIASMNVPDTLDLTEIKYKTEKYTHGKNEPVRRKVYYKSVTKSNNYVHKLK